MVLFRTVAAGEAFVQVCRPELDLGVASSKFRKPLADFRSGTSQVLISNDKLVSEGIDVPNANLLIQVIQNSSDIITSQALGRVLRKSEGDAIVIDVTVSGYAQFDRAQNARASVYASITDDVSLMGTK
jgi:superfamily II DNA or RNA helicase